jgi:uncharacterized protein (DUF58 family)
MPWRGRLDAWLLARRPPTDAWELTQRNVYILPTAAGLGFALTLLLLLLASINYQLNLGFVLTFLLAGAAVVSMHITHGTLRGLTLRMHPPRPVFAGEPATLRVTATHGGAARHGIGLSLHRQDDRVWIDVGRGAQADADLRFVAATRGVHTLPAVTVETRFPFGLFRAWSVWRPAATLLVYPRPETPAPPLPVAHAIDSAQAAVARQGTHEPDGVRAYRRGDPLRSIAWKKVARTGELVTREGSARQSAELWLDWAATGSGDTEARLARLTAWVLAADESGLRCGLRLPGGQWPPDGGPAHRDTLLRALALHA